MADEHKHGHKGEHSHGHEHEHHDDKHSHGHAAHEEHGPDQSHGHSHGDAHSHEDAHAHGNDHSHEADHAHGHEHEQEHGHSHGQEHKTHFHDPAHAADFDQRALSDIRINLTTKLIEALTLKGDELILDLATGTGRVARPLSKTIKGGNIVGVDQALAMLDVGHQHKDPITHYVQSAGEADKLPFKNGTFH